MKKLIIIVTIISSFGLTGFTNNEKTKTEFVQEKDFCDGWGDGYCEGWKDIKGVLSICPIAPLCAIPEIGLNTYKGGYNAGFKAGSKAAKK